jgi:hypothetical protein
MENSGMRRNETIELAPDQFVGRFDGATLNAPIIGGSTTTCRSCGLERLRASLRGPSAIFTVNQLLDIRERRVFTKWPRNKISDDATAVYRDRLTP